MEDTRMLETIIKVSMNDNQQPIVSGRELHEFLGIGIEYTEWFYKMCEYGFEENQDFVVIVRNDENPISGRPSAEHVLTIDTAKEIAMIQRSDKGKIARQYFIQLEKCLNNPEKIIARALMTAGKQLKTLKLENTKQAQVTAELNPKTDYIDKILANKSLMTVSQISKDYGMSVREMNSILHYLGIQYKQGSQWLLHAKYHSNGYTHSKPTIITYTSGLEEIIMNTKWTQKGRLFIYELLKNRNILPTIEIE